MNKQIKLLSLLVIAMGLIFSACKKDEAPVLTLASLKSGATDLNGATAATGVSTTENIVAVFSTNVDAATVNSTTIKLMNGGTDVPATITPSGTTVTIDPTNDLVTGGLFTLAINGVKSDQGQALGSLSVTFTTQGVGLETPPQKDAQTMYLQFDNSIVDLKGNSTVTFQQISFTTDRFSKANAAVWFNGATANGNGDLVELSGTGFINPSTTISVWFKVDPLDYVSGSKIMFGLATERGYFQELSANDGWMKFATSHKVDPDPANHFFGTAWNDPNGSGTHAGALAEYVGSIKDFLGTNWNQLVMTYDAGTQIKTIYVNNTIMLQVTLAAPDPWNLTDMALADKLDVTGDPAIGLDPVLALGFFCSRANTSTGWTDYSTSMNTYKGALDDMRIWNKALTASEVSALYTSEKP